MIGNSAADDRPPSAAGRGPAGPPAPRQRRVRRYVGGEDDRAPRPDSERDEIWGDPATDDGSERLRRDVPPHHGG